MLSSSLDEVNALAEIIQYNYTLGRTEFETSQDLLAVFVESVPQKKSLNPLKKKSL
jgi:hypothetical protein